jgi:hypothetical protein
MNEMCVVKNSFIKNFDAADVVVIFFATFVKIFVNEKKTGEKKRSEKISFPQKNVFFLLRFLSLITVGLSKKNITLVCVNA